MNALHTWWESEVIHGEKGPLLLGFVSFVITFVATRGITRAIRAGKGPFRNISHGGVHLHHSTPGVLLLVTGAFVSLGAVDRTPLRLFGALLVGVGASLVLDEFAMILHLQDVYWSQEGQLSVNIVTLAGACIGLAVVGVSPANVYGLSDTAQTVRGVLMLALLVHLVFVAITAFKGKYPTALIGLFIAPVSWYAAVRLARPTSPWARRFYDDRRKEHAASRDAQFDKRWGPVRARWADFIGGTPSQPNPSP